MVRFCSNCGTEILENSFFCDKCGYELKTSHFSQRNVHSSPRTNTPYFYRSYNRSPSQGLKWFFLAVFVIVVLGLVAMTAIVFGLMYLLPVSNDYGNNRHQTVNEVKFNLADYSLTTLQPGVLEFTVTVQNNGDVITPSCK